MSAPVCLEGLHGCHLNLLREAEDLVPSYVANEATQEQLAILRSLRMLELVDDDAVAARIRPRDRS